MTTHKQFSDEHLNAFIDDQLTNSERAELLDAIRHDHELSQRVCKLQKLHNLVQLSYESIDVPERHNTSDRKTEPQRLKWFATASVLLIMGTISGWIANENLGQKKLYEIAEIKQNNNTANSEKWRLMLHVSTANPRRLNIVLDEMEVLLEQYANSKQKLQLEVLTNSEGLALVKNNGKTYNQRLVSLKKKYNNLVVLACNQTLQRLQKTYGKQPALLPDTNIVPSAINQIIKRQKEGWSYIRI